MTQGQSSGNIPQRFDRAVGEFAVGALSTGVAIGITSVNFGLLQQPNTEASIAAIAAFVVGGGLTTKGGVELEAVKRSLKAEASANQPSDRGLQR